MPPGSRDKTIAVLNGPNLHALGKRAPEIYGAQTLAEIEAACRAHAKSLGFSLTFMQTDSEGALVEAVHQAGREACGIVLNGAAYTHTSLALGDAVESQQVPVIEVHLSNVYAREEFRQHSFTAPFAAGVIAGLGLQGYLLAISALAEKVKTKT